LLQDCVSPEESEQARQHGVSGEEEEEEEEEEGEGEKEKDK
jgi:hypothetical protein